MEREASIATRKAAVAPELPQMLDRGEGGLNRDFMPRAALGLQAELQAGKMKAGAMEEGRKAGVVDLKAGEKQREQDKEHMLRGKDGKDDRPVMERNQARPDLAKRRMAFGAEGFRGGFGGFQGGQGFGGGLGGRAMPGQWAAGAARPAGGVNAS